MLHLFLGSDQFKYAESIAIIEKKIEVVFPSESDRNAMAKFDDTRLAPDFKNCHGNSPNPCRMKYSS